MDNKHEEYINMLRGISKHKTPQVYEVKSEQKEIKSKKNNSKTSKEAYTVFRIAQHDFENFYDYEPETIQNKLNLDLIELEGLLCCQNIWHNLTAFFDWHVFEKTCVVLNQRHANFLITQDTTPSEIFYAVFIMRQIDDHSLFTDEVLQYISVMLHHEGLITLPEILGYNLMKEESYTGLSLQFYLDSLNKHDKIHSESAQSEIFNNIKKYVEDRVHKSSIELKELS